MKRCDYCPPHDGPRFWLDGMARGDNCPDCGGPLTWFRPARAGAVLDAVSMEEDDG